MAMTITEKILAAHAGLDRVGPGELIEVDACSVDDGSGVFGDGNLFGIS